MWTGVWTATPVLLAGGVLSYWPHAYNCPPCSRWVGYGRVGTQCAPCPGAPCGGEEVLATLSRVAVEEGGRTLWPGPLHHLAECVVWLRSL